MKKAPTAIILSVLLISVIAGIHFNLAKGQLFDDVGEVAPPPNAIYPKVTVSSIKNDTVYRENRVSLNLSITIIMPPRPVYFANNAMWFSGVYYKASWLSNNTYIDIGEYMKSVPTEKMLGPSDEYFSQFGFGTNYIYEGKVLSPSFTINLTGIPEGINYLEVFAVEKGYKQVYEKGFTFYYGEYELLGSSMVRFTIDTIPPNISNLSLINKTYNSNDVALSFNVNETSQISYSIDGNANTTLLGNTTLAGISDGSHHIVVYANDSAGNMGKSDISYFSIDTTYPVINVSSIENMAFHSSSLLLNFTINEPISWMAYKLDNQTLTPITGNVTLTDLAEGPHNLIIYANDTAGNIAISMTNFNVNTTTPTEPQSFPIELVIAIATIGFLSIALAFCFRKYHRKK